MGPGFSGIFVAAIVFLTQFLALTDGRDIGVCYGLNGDNLPSPKDVVNLYKLCLIDNIRMYEPYPDALEELRGRGISVTMGPRNEEIQGLSEDQNAADAWVSTNIVPYKDDISFKYITIGNEVIPGPLGDYVTSAMTNIRNALGSIGLKDTVKVTTVLPMNALDVSYPPSAGVFTSDITSIMTDVANFLAQQDAPLMINVYPYFAYTSNPAQISSEYALCSSTAPIVIDQGLEYYCLFDAQVDAFNAALENINFGGVNIVVAETGWPTLGNEPYTSVSNAQAYNKNFLNHAMQKGTPKKPEYIMPFYFFEMFNEDLKQGPVEQNFGFFYPNMSQVYPFFGEIKKN